MFFLVSYSFCIFLHLKKTANGFDSLNTDALVANTRSSHKSLLKGKWTMGVDEGDCKFLSKVVRGNPRLGAEKPREQTKWKK